jgi:arylsulfatase A-like enzyme
VRAITSDPSLHTPDNVDYLTSLYDAEVAFTDESWGQLTEELRRLDFYDQSLIVFTADHGEELHEHGRFGHGHSLYHEQTQVPLIVRFPGGRGRRVSALARQIDLVPTLLDYLGVAVPAGVDGRTLLHLAEGAGEGDEEAFTQTSLGLPQRGLVTAQWKVIESAGFEPRVEVYDLRADPLERNDVGSSATVLVGYSRQRLAQWTTTVPRPRYDPGGRPTAARMDEPTRRRLEALGYVDHER